MSVQAGPAAQRESAEIREVVLEFYRRMLAGDADGANDLISRDAGTLMIGSAGEWVQDQEALRTGRLPDGEGLEAGPAPLAYELGDSGWFADQPTWIFADGSRAQMRMTAVLAREVAGWRIVHAHLSVAVPDDECVMLQRRWRFGIPAPEQPEASE
jgi:SnoaL-like domain